MVVALSLFLATIVWPGASREALILQADGGVLLGMAALSGNRLTLEVADHGIVTVEPL